MTDKRYDVIDKEEPRGQSVTYNGIPCTARHCCTNLNKLTEENEQLKSKNRGLQSELQIFKEDVTHSNLQINKLIDENEQLKQQEKRLYNYFRKCFDNVSEQGFQETWEVVKKYD